jgi:hypothetical protein
MLGMAELSLRQLLQQQGTLVSFQLHHPGSGSRERFLLEKGCTGECARLCVFVNV